MMRDQYEKQLLELNKSMMEMGGLCEDAITIAVPALHEDNPELAAQVAEIDSKIDRLERDIEAQCMRLLLKQQPVARDLRAVSAALKMVTDMERIGDQAEDIVEILPYLKQCDGKEMMVIYEMEKAVIHMVTASIDAYVRQNTVIAEQVIADDDYVDTLFDKSKKALIDLIAADPANGECAIDLLMVCKYLERIGDHATNVAEWVIFSVVGEHTKESPDQKMPSK